MTNKPAVTLRVGDWSVNRLTGELARAGGGLVLDRVRLVSRAPRVGVDVEASGLGSAP